MEYTDHATNSSGVIVVVAKSANSVSGVASNGWFSDWADTTIPFIFYEWRSAARIASAVSVLCFDRSYIRSDFMCNGSFE